MKRAFVGWSITALFLSITGQASSPQFHIASAQEHLQKKNCATLLRALKKSYLSEAEHKDLSARLQALRLHGDRVLATPQSRAIFNYAVDRFQSLVTGTRPSLVPVDVTQDLERMRGWLQNLLHKPKAKPREHEKLFARATLERIDQALRQPTRGSLTADAWTFLAIDLARSLTPMLEDQDKLDQPPKRLRHFVGDRMENILLPAWITTTTLSIPDFNEASVVPAVLGGIVPTIVHVDGQVEGDNPSEFLIDHDLLFHGTDLRRKRLRLMTQELELFGYHYDSEHESIIPLQTNDPGHATTFRGTSHWIIRIERNLSILEALHSRVALLPPRTQDAVSVLRFFAEHEEGEFLLFYGTHGSHSFRSFLHSPIEATTGVYQTSSPERDLLIRLKRKNDIGDEYPLLGALPTVEISQHLMQAAEFLDSLLPSE